MAFEELHRPLFREHGSIHFANDNKPSKEYNYAFCEVCLLLHLCLNITFLQKKTLIISQNDSFLSEGCSKV